MPYGSLVFWIEGSKIFRIPFHLCLGIISSDNGLQYANLDGSELKAAGYAAAGYPGSGHSHQAYQAHHSLVQATYAHHYGKGFLSINYYFLRKSYQPFHITKYNLLFFQRCSHYRFMQIMFFCCLRNSK